MKHNTLKEPQAAPPSLTAQLAAELGTTPAQIRARRRNQAAAHRNG